MLPATGTTIFHHGQIVAGSEFLLLPGLPATRALDFTSALDLQSFTIIQEQTTIDELTSFSFKDGAGYKCITLCAINILDIMIIYDEKTPCKTWQMGCNGLVLALFFWRHFVLLKFSKKWW